MDNNTTNAAGVQHFPLVKNPEPIATNFGNPRPTDRRLSGVSKRDAAITLAEQGLRVFRLEVNGKRPAFGGWQQEATSDPEVVRKLWTGRTGNAMPYNIGVAPDPNLLVFDEDVSGGKQGDKSRELLEMLYEQLPVTLVVRSARGGKHRYYATPSPVANSTSKVGTHIDIKSAGGLVVGPGSVIDGTEYVIETDAPIAEAPRWLIDMAGAPRERHHEDTVTPLVELDAPSAISRATEWIETRAPEAGTYAVACKVRSYGVSRDVCLDLLMERWPPAEAKGEEHVAFRVDNAYRYAQDPPGIASAEAEFDAVEIDSAKPSPSRKGLAFRNIAEFKWSTDQGGYLVQGFMNRGMLAVMSAPSNAGKSPLALDLTAHIAMGKPWRGMKIKQPHYVLHYSTEGFTGLGNRMEAVRREHFVGAERVPFDFVSGSLDMRTSTNDTKAIIATINERAAAFGVPAGLVVIDTLSHALGGGDDSNQEHMRALLKNCSAIAHKTGAAVLLLHHPTKSASSDYRGSSVMLNDIDLMVKVETDAKTKRRTMTTPRVKEFAEMEPMQFNMKVVRLGEDEDGDAITSVVVDWINQAEVEFEAKLTPPQEEVLAAFDELITRRKTAGAKSNTTVATFSDWKESLRLARTAIGRETGENQLLVRCLPALIENGLVAKTSFNQYVRLTP
jgi:hypothetical protein